MTAFAGAKSKIKNHPRVALVVFLLVVMAGGLIFVTIREPVTTATQDATSANDAFIKGDKPLALKNAKKALAKDPNNMNTMLLVAKLTKENNPDESKRYYAQALDVIIKYDKPDEPGKPASVYWAAGDLAERAGKTEQAKVYYSKVAAAANPQNGYEQSLIPLSKERLERLQ